MPSEDGISLGMPTSPASTLHLTRRPCFFPTRANDHWAGAPRANATYRSRQQRQQQPQERLTSSRVVTEETCLTAHVGWSNVWGLSSWTVAPGTADDKAPLVSWVFVGVVVNSSKSPEQRQENARWRWCRELRWRGCCGRFCCPSSSITDKAWTERCRRPSCSGVRFSRIGHT